jgi:hypothetical protein
MSHNATLAGAKCVSKWLSTLLVPNFCSSLLQPFLVGGPVGSQRQIPRQEACNGKNPGVLCGRPSEKNVTGSDACDRQWANLFSFDFSEAGTMGLKSLC